jgi:hypothetical protein
MARFLAAKTIGGFRPIDDAGEELLRKIKRGEVVMIEVKRPRNVLFHRKYWALVNIVHENLDHDRYPTPDAFHQALKICAGLRTEIHLPEGQVGYIPGSIAFHKMDADSFSAFFDRVCNLVARHFLPGVDEDALRAEVEEMIGVRESER